MKAKEARQKVESSIKEKVNVQYNNIKTLIQKAVDSDRPTFEIYVDDCILSEVKELLLKEGYMVKTGIQTGNNEYSTKIAW